MNNNITMSKFRRSDQGLFCVRDAMLSSGKYIVFGVSATDLTNWTPGKGVSLDQESDLLIEQFKDSDQNLIFEYSRNGGFISVDPRSQNWYIFD